MSFFVRPAARPVRCWRGCGRRCSSTGRRRPRPTSPSPRGWAGGRRGWTRLFRGGGAAWRRSWRRWRCATCRLCRRRRGFGMINEPHKQMAKNKLHPQDLQPKKPKKKEPPFVLYDFLRFCTGSYVVFVCRSSRSLRGSGWGSGWHTPRGRTWRGSRSRSGPRPTPGGKWAARWRSWRTWCAARSSPTSSLTPPTLFELFDSPDAGFISSYNCRSQK